MQNKPNLPNTQMNASYAKTKNYEQNTMEAEPAKQTQSKPISWTSATDFYYLYYWAGAGADEAAEVMGVSLKRAMTGC